VNDELACIDMETAEEDSSPSLKRAEGKDDDDERLPTLRVPTPKLRLHVTRRVGDDDAP
jgi:hypothetical protein